MSVNLTQGIQQYSTFRVDDLLLGVEVTRVQEVIRYQPMTVVPLAPCAVEGLINLRGQIVVALDLRRSLGLPPAPAGTLPMNVVIQSEDSVVSFLVDDVGDVIDVPPETYAPVPENMPADQRELIQCVHDLDDGLMLVLDTTRVLQNACFHV
ncbi:MAG: chemotaxis protein CheW [Janthinobacterium lividum]